MTNDESEQEIYRVCGILESIAAQYPEDSPEYLAVRDAAVAFTIVNQHKQLLTSYRRRRELMNGGDFTAEEKAAFKSRGIDVDALEAEDQF